MKSVDVAYKKLKESHDKYQFAIKEMTKELTPFIDFPFSVFYQSSDGFIVLHNEESYNAPLKYCLPFIREKGKLSYEDYIRICI